MSLKMDNRDVAGNSPRLPSGAGRGFPSYVVPLRRFIGSAPTPLPPRLSRWAAQSGGFCTFLVSRDPRPSWLAAPACFAEDASFSIKAATRVGRVPAL
jgi:hypothetical protein